MADPEKGKTVKDKPLEVQPLVLGTHTFNSRLIVGTGKYKDFETMNRALAASGTECVTVALRRIRWEAKEPTILDALDRKKYVLLPNTAGCTTAEEAIRVADLARELSLSEFIKLEVIGDPERTLYPDVEETLKATRLLVKEGFCVLAYTTDDPVTARKLEEAGAASVMPLGAPIGSGLGLLNPYNIQTIIQHLSVPVIVDAGVGTASDVALAMEMGADGVLLNTGIALAQEPVQMAQAMKLACEAGRLACLSGRIPKKPYASASSPPAGVVR